MLVLQKHNTIMHIFFSKEEKNIYAAVTHSKKLHF